MQNLSCAEIQVLLQQGGQLVDVRTPMEFFQGAVPGAINVPVQNLSRARDQLDPGRPVLVYCRSGQRSAYARQWLLAMGFHNVVDLGAPYYFADCIPAEAAPVPEVARVYA